MGGGIGQRSRGWARGQTGSFLRLNTPKELAHILTLKSTISIKLLCYSNISTDLFFVQCDISLFGHRTFCVITRCRRRFLDSGFCGAKKAWTKSVPDTTLLVYSTTRQQRLRITIQTHGLPDTSNLLKRSFTYNTNFSLAKIQDCKSLYLKDMFW